MPLTAGDAQDHVRNTLAGDPSSELSLMGLVNQAGRYLYSMHAWRFTDRRAASIALEKNTPYARLPVDFGALRGEAVADPTTSALLLRLTDLPHIIALRGNTDMTGPPYWAALGHRSPLVPNLLAYSDAFDRSPWAFATGTGTVSADTATNPYTGETAADQVADESSGAISALTQTVSPYRLATAPFTAIVTMRPSPVTATSPPKSAIFLETESPATGLQSKVEIQWGTTPWQDAPTATFLANTAGATLLDPVAVGEGYWEFGISGFGHELDENYGRLKLGIEPSRASHASASGTEDATQEGAVDVVRAQLHQGYLPLVYRSNGENVYVPKAPEPVLEIWPTPTETDTEAFTVPYRARWVDAEDDSDELAVPWYAQDLYVAILRQIARGLEEEDQGTVEARLSLLRGSALFVSAAGQDATQAYAVGRIRRGALATASGRFHDPTSYRVSLPGS